MMHAHAGGQHAVAISLATSGLVGRTNYPLQFFYRVIEVKSSAYWYAFIGYDLNVDDFTLLELDR